MAQFKEIISSVETHVSEKVNKLTERMTACENIDALKDVQRELKEVLQEFQIAHEAYHRLIKTESEQEESTRYCNSVLEIVSELELEISSWINQPKSPPILEERSEHICLHDSRTSLRTRSAVSSRSSASAKARSAARKAALEARPATLESLHQVQIEELKLQQRKTEIELRAEIAEAEAERKVFEEAEASEGVKSDHHPRENYQFHPAAQESQQVKVASTPREGLVADSHEPNKKTPLNPRSPEWCNAMSQNHPSVPVSYQSGSFHEESFQRLMENQDRQNGAIQQLVQQRQQGVMSLTLPQPDMQVFSGDPIDYCDFVRAFDLKFRLSPVLSGAVHLWSCKGADEELSGDARRRRLSGS